MDSCTRCNWSGPAGLATCPRCGQPLGSAAAPTIVQGGGRPVLLLKLLGGELPPGEWEIEGVAVGIGRLDDSDVTLPHRSVSRHHARIVPTSNGYEVEDLGSTNGTWLNDRPLNDRTALADGDSLMVGDIPLVVELIQPQRQAEIYDVPQLPAAPSAPARAPQAAAGGGASTVFYELDAAIAAAGPAEPAPLQPAQPPADYQRTPPLQPAQAPADYQRTQGAPPAPPPADQRTPPLQQAQPPADYQRAAPLQPAQPPADYQRAAPLQPAQPPADYQRAVPLQPAQRPADYQRTPPSVERGPATPEPPEVEVPRAWDDTPSTRLDLPHASAFAGADAAEAGDEHPTLIGDVPVQQFQSPTTSSAAPPTLPPPPQRGPTPTAPQTPWNEPSPAPPQYQQSPAPPREPSPASPEYERSPGGQAPRYEPAPAYPEYERSPAGGQSPRYEGSAVGGQVPRYEAPQGAVRTEPGAPAVAPSAGLPDLSAVGMIELAEHLATALRLLKGDIALATWLFEHAGGPPAAQAFVELVRRLQAEPDDPQHLAELAESAPTAARLLEAAILLVNVLASLDPPGGVDNQLEANAADLQPVARS